MRHLHQHAGAVTGVGLATAGTAVIEVAQDFDGLLQDGIRLAPLDVDHEAETAGVLFELRIVETLLPGTLGTGGVAGRHRRTPYL